MEKETKDALYFIAVAELVGILSGLISGNAAQIYSGLVQPAFSPPGWVFGPVWVILYALMGYAAFLISSENTKESRKALQYYRLQLLFNFLWPIVFFKFNLYIAAAIVLIGLTVLVIITAFKFKQIDPLAFKLLLPYILWLFYATYLNLGVVFLNRP